MDPMETADQSIVMAQTLAGSKAALVNEGFAPENAERVVVAMLEKAAADAQVEANRGRRLKLF